MHTFFSLLVLLLFAVSTHIWACQDLRDTVQATTSGFTTIPEFMVNEISEYLSNKELNLLSTNNFIKETTKDLRNHRKAGKKFIGYAISERPVSNSLIQYLLSLPHERRKNTFRAALVEVYKRLNSEDSGDLNQGILFTTSHFQDELSELGINQAVLDTVLASSHQSTDYLVAVQQHLSDHFYFTVDGSVPLEKTHNALIQVIADGAEANAKAQFVVSTQEEFSTIIGQANHYFIMHPESTLVIMAAADRGVGGGVDGGVLFLRSIDIPLSLKKLSIVGNHIISIKEYTLAHTELTQVTIPNSVTTIEDGFLFNCMNLTWLTVPQSVNFIGELFLESCRKLTQVTLPSSLTSIGNFFLKDCTSLKEVHVPNSVTSIGNYFLKDCTSITGVDVSNSVTSIGKNFLDNCVSLINLDLTSLIYIKRIGENFLKDCTELNRICLLESQRDGLISSNIPKALKNRIIYGSDTKP